VKNHIDECDLLLIAGDVCPIAFGHDVHIQRNWMRKYFFPFLNELPAKHIVWIAGNHDFVCEVPGFKRIADEAGDHIHYIQDEVIDIDGVTIYGSPWVPNLPNWAFHGDANKFQILSQTIPETDILLLHGPPNGILDQVWSGDSVGSPFYSSMLQYRITPKHVVFGHIHEAHGELTIGETTFHNVSYLDDDYRPRYLPHRFEV
jgi:Icc-related predicted phosphoesterase